MFGAYRGVNLRELVLQFVHALAQRHHLLVKARLDVIVVIVHLLKINRFLDQVAKLGKVLKS
jgi:hypothetical protein